jgi:hypothetical protein
MYEYRDMSDEEKSLVLDARKQRGYPWHSPPHIENIGGYRLITATCYKHQPVLNSWQRLQWIEEELLSALNAIETPPNAWRFTEPLSHLDESGERQGCHKIAGADAWSHFKGHQ